MKFNAYDSKGFKTFECGDQLGCTIAICSVFIEVSECERVALKVFQQSRRADGTVNITSGRDLKQTENWPKGFGAAWGLLTSDVPKQLHATFDGDAPADADPSYHSRQS